MNINDIMNTYKERMWLIMCKRNNINPWDLIDKLQVKVYITYKLIGKVEAKSKYCLICGTEFSIQRSCGSYVLETICKCAHDGSSTQTLNKWKSYMPEDEAITLIKEANYKRCKGIRFSITHWLQKGYSLEQAKIEVAKIQKELNKLSPSSKPGARFSRRTKEYWIRKGFTEEESKEKVKEVQTTNGMEFYTKKYGAEQGKILFENRIEKWLNSINSRLDIKDINRRKGVSKEQWIEKIGLDGWLERDAKRIIKMLATKFDTGQISDRNLLEEKEIYYSKVRYYTQKSLNFYYEKINPLNLRLSNKEYHIDHIFSRNHGFMFNIPPEIIGSYINLRPLPYKENLAKGYRSDYTLEQVKELYENIDKNWHIIVSNSKI
jgi:hypothetical protein